MILAELFDEIREGIVALLQAMNCEQSQVTRYVGYVATTEVYPDSPLVDDENCILAQVAAVTGGLDYIRKINESRKI